MNNIFYVTNDREHVLDKDRFIEELKRKMITSMISLIQKCLMR